MHYQHGKKNGVHCTMMGIYGPLRNKLKPGSLDESVFSSVVNCSIYLQVEELMQSTQLPSHIIHSPIIFVIPEKFNGSIQTSTTKHDSIRKITSNTNTLRLDVMSALECRMITELGVLKERLSSDKTLDIRPRRKICTNVEALINQIHTGSTFPLQPVPRERKMPVDIERILRR